MRFITGQKPPDRDAGSRTKTHEGPPWPRGVGQPEGASEHSDSASHDTPEVTTTRALVDAVMDAVAAGDTVAARAAAKGLLAYLDALPGNNDRVLNEAQRPPRPLSKLAERACRSPAQLTSSSPPAAMGVLDWRIQPGKELLMKTRETEARFEPVRALPGIIAQQRDIMEDLTGVLERVMRQEFIDAQPAD